LKTNKITFNIRLIKAQRCPDLSQSWTNFIGRSISQTEEAGAVEPQQPVGQPRLIPVLRLLKHVEAAHNLCGPGLLAALQGGHHDRPAVRRDSGSESASVFEQRGLRSLPSHHFRHDLEGDSI